MKLSHKIITFIAAGTLAFAASAQDSQQAASLPELLRMVQQSKVSESREHQQREAQFKKNKANQAGELRKAEQTKAAEEARSARLEAQYDQQEVLVKAKREQLEERLGSLKELFGHLTSTAGDLRSNIDSSIVSAQLPDRTEFLSELIDKMNSETKLPTIGEIEKLWYEIQRETIESGRVVKFNAEVADSSGNTTTSEVVRIGNYNLVSNGKYLSYDSDTGSISILARQPESKHTSGAAALQNASVGFTRVGIDPTGPAGGNLLKALINLPGLKERIEQGGIVGKVIIAVGIVGVLIAIWRFFVLAGIGGKIRSQLKANRANPNNPLGRILKVAEDNPGIDGESLELKLEEAILKERPNIENYLQLIKIISMVAPLLGLLGTVVGMIITFQAITVFGAGDPKAMAGGISGALVTTVLGLCVAIPTVLLHTLLNSKAKSVVHILEEQSAGLIAEKAERK
jgi:biopolymer transport protein ExbB